MEKKKITNEEKSKVITFLMFSFPTLIIVGLAMLTDVTETWWAMISISVYQFILMKQFIDKYYEVI